MSAALGFTSNTRFVSSKSFCVAFSSICSCGVNAPLALTRQTGLSANRVDARTSETLSFSASRNSSSNFWKPGSSAALSSSGSCHSPSAERHPRCRSR